MYYYFSSKNRCAVKLNGIYIGTIGKEQKRINVLDDNALVELLPLRNVGRSVCFNLDEDFLSNPPSFIYVVDLMGGYSIYYDNYHKDEDFKIIRQQKFNNALATLHFDKSAILSIETPMDFYTAVIKEDVKDASFRLLGGKNDLLTLIVSNFEEEQTLKVFSLREQIKEVFSGVFNNVEVGDVIKTEKRYNTIAKHKVFSEYIGDNCSLKLNQAHIEKDASFSVDTLNEKIIAYAFLEDYMIGEDVSFYLSDNLRENAHKLGAYLGDIISVITPPFFRDYKEIGLLRKIKDNLFRVDYAKVEIENRKVVNIKIL